MTDEPNIHSPTSQAFDFATSLAEYKTLALATQAVNRDTFFNALAATPITRIVVNFDGYGDSGQIESMRVEAGDQVTTLPTGQVEIATASFGSDEICRRPLARHEAVETLAYDLLEQTHGGWENNEGAYGEFVFDVARRTITLDCNERFLDTTYSHQIF